jgi:hypothetical protein
MDNLLFVAIDPKHLLNSDINHNANAESQHLTFREHDVNSAVSRWGHGVTRATSIESVLVGLIGSILFDG